VTDRQLLERARDRLDRAAAREPGNFRFQAERALVLWDLGLGDAASSVFDRVLALHPNLVNAMLLKASLDLQNRDPSGRRPWAEVYDLLMRGLRIMPHEAPELRLALAQLLDLFRIEAGDPHGIATNDAAQQYRQAIAGREYMPLARIGLARLLLETPGPLEEVAALLQKAEENAALEPDRLAECARLYAHPRLAAEQPGVFGVAGAKTLRVWERVLGLTFGRHPEARLEMQMAPLNRMRHGGPVPAPEDLASMLAVADDILEGDPRNLLARSYRAVCLERLDRLDEALFEWGLLARAGQQEGWKSPRMREILDEAVEATQRIRERKEGRRRS
jgi:tetratricopeptide (TPR) repeat protein